MNHLLVRNAKTIGKKKGDAKKAWDNLLAEYEPRTGVDLVNIKSKFHSSKMRSNRVDPLRFIAYLERLKARAAEMNYEISDMDLKIQICQNMTKEYNTVTIPWMKNLETIELHDMKKEITSIYSLLKRQNSNWHETKTITTMSMMTMKQMKNPL